MELDKLSMGENTEILEQTLEKTAQEGGSSGQS